MLERIMAHWLIVFAAVANLAFRKHIKPPKVTGIKSSEGKHQWVER